MDIDISDEKSDWVLPAHQARSRRQLERLLKAGERVFATRGFSDSHVSGIVKEAKCSVGSFYRRFKDKEALFLALQQNMYENTRQNIDKFFANPLCQNSPITAVIFRFIENTGTEMHRIQGYYRALFEISLRGRDVWAQMRELEDYQAQSLQQLLVKRGKKNLRADFLPSMSHAFRAINGAIISLLLHGKGPYGFNDRRTIADFTRMVMAVAGLKPDENVLQKLLASRQTVGRPRAAKTSR